MASAPTDVFEPAMDALGPNRGVRWKAICGARSREGEFESALPADPRTSTPTAITGCEALVRWHHPERGIVPPAEFIPVAEEIGLIVPLGEWVLRKACADAATWPDDIKVAVNLSPPVQSAAACDDRDRRASRRPVCRPSRLELEITEIGAACRTAEATLATLHQLRQLGVSMSMDDFGTGFSVAELSAQFPFDKIKIDRCFVADLPGTDSMAIVRAVIGLAAQPRHDHHRRGRRNAGSK